ncbi:MAG: hypothetical protein AAB573_00480 [Patescibacteria group bacterium]
MAREERFKRRIDVKLEGSNKTIIVRFKGGVWTVFKVREYSSGLEVNNANTFPEHRVGEGYGTEALHVLKTYAKNRGHKAIYARGVLDRPVSFWTRAGFTPWYGSNYEFIIKENG